MGNNQQERSFGSRGEKRACWASAGEPMHAGWRETGPRQLRAPRLRVPCLLSEKAHRCRFRLCALDADLDLKPGAAREDMEGAAEGHVPGQAQPAGLVRLPIRARFLAGPPGPASTGGSPTPHRPHLTSFCSLLTSLARVSPRTNFPFSPSP
jgi:hypothetical protein